MKKTMKGIIAFICFIIALAIMINGLSKIFIPKWKENDSMQTYMMRGFYDEKKDSIKVLNVGDSDVYRGVSPNIIWNTAKIPSYTLSSSSQRMWQSYYLIKHALNYQSPEVIFLEVNACRYDSGREIAMMHQFFDNMLLDQVKWEALQDEVFEFTPSQKLNFLFPILEFHSRYSELTKEDFTLGLGNLHYAEKGFAMKTEIQPYKGSMTYMKKKKDKNFHISVKTKKYLDMIVKLCKERNIRLVLFKTPEPTNWRLEHHEAVNEYAKTHHLDFLDYNIGKQLSLFDMEKDTMDKGTHLNVYGAEKLSKSLAEYLQNILKIEPETNQETIQIFDKDYKIFLKDKKRYEAITSEKES
jgi:hypothetical protein